MHLYGPATLHWLRLALTDDNSQSHGAFDGTTQVLACYSNAISMLCVFHAIIMKYHDTVYGKLPKQKGTRLLTNAADLYGKRDPYNVVIRHLHLSTNSMFAVESCLGDIVFQWFMKMSKDCRTPAEYNWYHA